MNYEKSQPKDTNYVSINSLIQTKKHNGIGFFSQSAATVQGKTAIQDAEHTAPIQKQANHTGLPDNLKTGVESLSGFSMDDVRVHYNSSKPAQMQALAYTQGTDIHVASGQEKHLSHEAWHVVQQKQGRVQPTFQMKGMCVGVNDDPGLEREASKMGMKALQALGTDEYSVLPKENKSLIGNAAPLTFQRYSVIQMIVNPEYQEKIKKCLEECHIKLSEEINDVLSVFFEAKNTFTAYINLISNLHKLVGEERCGKEAPYGSQYYMNDVVIFEGKIKSIIDEITELEMSEESKKSECRDDYMDDDSMQVLEEKKDRKNGTYIIKNIDKESDEIEVNGMSGKISLSEFWIVPYIKIGDTIELIFDGDGEVDDAKLKTFEETNVGTNPANTGKILAISVSQQSTDKSCWASVCASVGNFLKHTTEWSETNISSLVKKPLEEGYNVEETLKTMRISATSCNDVAEISLVREKIDAGKPIIANISGNEIGHSVIIGGYILDDKCPIDSKLKIFDPQFGAFYWVTYRHFVLGTTNIKKSVFERSHQMPGFWNKTILL
jgi:hypothetical protein